MTQEAAETVGVLVRDARSDKGWTQGRLAAELGTSQSAVARMEQGKQNLSLKMIQRMESIFGRSIVNVGGKPKSQVTHLRVFGGRELSGSVDVNSSKNAGVALLCASPDQPRHHHAAPPGPHRRGQPHRGAADLHRRRVHLAQRQRPADPPPRRAGPGLHGRRGRPPHPQRHHAARPAAGRVHQLPHPVRRWLRPGHPHRGAAHAGPARIRPERHGPRRASTACRPRRATPRTAPLC